MPIRQLQVANDSLQDRLILRIGTHANEEIRVHFTRRFVRELWPHLTALLAGHLAPNTVEPRLEDDDVPSGENASFEQAFVDENPYYPLGASPLLASEVKFDISDATIAKLTLREGRERSFTINLNTELLQALCAMLRAATEQAGWDLALDYTAPARMAKAPVNSLLH